ncbi:MAG: hypothetical protein OXG40_03435 [Acidimicrobiaceae bacterium]|nr:hypothetical protein [Acidimicrobiaceae bacterium]MCY3648768.1 hypothetical protein [Acidimicrobiaceae bacterium]MDE0656426.1 hypothetical protein [Acidimicrobiaceae bacterium]
MEADHGSRPVMGMSLSLAVARRALLLALVALLVAVVALVAAFVADSGSDDAADDVDTADLAEARTAAAAAQASAEDAAIMSAASAAKADEAAVVAQEAVVMAQQAAAAAEAAAAQAAAAVEALAAAQAAAAADGGTQPADTSDEETEAETTGATETDAAGATEEADETAEPAAETGADDTDAATDTEDADASETGGDESGEASTDGADGAPEPAVSLPGEPYEFGPPAGAALAVVGVSHDSVLNVRDVPAGEIVARLDNVMNVGSEPVVYVREADSDALIATLDLNRGVIATGNTRKLPTTIWHEIRMAEAVGWASSAFLSPLGATSDATAETVAVLGETPAASTLAELARIVAGAVASDDPPSRVVVSGAPVSGDLAEITVDVLGLPDDAVRGFRLQVFAQQDSDSGSFTLKSVESTTICDSHRGVSEEGLCN